jgi:hypothetical protein
MSAIDEDPKGFIRRQNDLIESLIESNAQKATQIGDLNRALFAANEENKRLTVALRRIADSWEGEEPAELWAIAAEALWISTADGD